MNVQNGRQIPETTPLRDIRKIAVLRANALGDFLFTLPALEALRVAYPDAEIVLLAKAWHAAFLSRRPSPIDRVSIVPPYKGVSSEAEEREDPRVQEEFFAEMQRERFDLALQLHGGGHYSNPFVQRLEANLTAGFKTPEAVPLDRWLAYSYFQPEITRYLEAVALVGAQPVVLDPRITIMPEDITEANNILKSREKPLVILHPGASDPRRRWPTRKFAEVGTVLAQQGAQIIVTGVESEREIAAEVVEAMGPETGVQNACGNLSLNGLAGLLAQARLVISNDTGPLHLACAVGVPAIGIYWAYNILTAGTLTRRYLRPIMSWRMRCPICEQDNANERCAHNVSFVADVTCKEVIERAREIYAE